MTSPVATYKQSLQIDARQAPSNVAPAALGKLDLQELKPTSNFDLRRYLGKWHNLLRIEAPYEKNTGPVTAEYHASPDGTIRVTNQGWQGSSWRTNVGTAVPDPTMNGVLLVSFFEGVWSPYVVLHLWYDSPVGPYQFALVGVPSHQSLWLLSRIDHIRGDLLMELRSTCIRIALRNGYVPQQLDRFQILPQMPPSPRTTLQSSSPKANIDTPLRKEATAHGAKQNNKVPPWVGSVERGTLENQAYRRVVYTARGMQLVYMRLLPGQAIGREQHADADQFIRVERGTAIVSYGNQQLRPDLDIVKILSPGDAVLIPAGTWHNVRNPDRSQPLQLYTVYDPPQHEPGLVEVDKPLEE